MKLSTLLIATVAAVKEWEVQDAYFAGDEVVLSDSNTRSNKQWHDCGDAPKKPWNGQAVKCSGAYCAAVCPQGSRSEGRWRIKCQIDNTWSHTKFSQCVTCPEIDVSQSNAVSQSIYRKNLPVTQFFCGDESDQLQIGEHVWQNGGKKKNIKCQCRNGQNGDPLWKKSCNWVFKGLPWNAADVASVVCHEKAAPVVLEQPTAYSCEWPDNHSKHPQIGDKRVELECNEGYVLRIDSAEYGKNNPKMCFDMGSPNHASTGAKKCEDKKGNRLFADHYDAVAAACDGKRKCGYHGHNRVAGDPCRGVAKHTEIKYSCVQKN
jgi:hypothetical protein